MGGTQLVDVGLTGIMVVWFMALAPIFFTFVAMVGPNAPEFPTLLLELALPILILALILSVGVSGGGR